MFANDLSIELETVHITDDFETHKRPNAGHTHAYVMNLSRAVSYVGAGTKNGRTTTAAGGSGSSATTAVASSQEKCPTHRGKMTVSSF